MPNKSNNISAARKVYETYWESYAKGDLETFASTLDDNYEMIGTSESEICHSKADGIAFFKGQMHEVVGKAEMRNRQIDVLPVENLMLVNEQCDVYVLVDSDWNFYSKIRISSFLRENESGWKVIQQHGSLPDMRVGEGETLAIDKINRENLELRDAVKRRTAELESKNKELAIESALERVRSRTMAMQNSNELSDVVSALYQQMETLGFAKYGCELILCNEKSGLLEYWHTNPMQSSVPECYCVSPEVHAFFKKVWKAWKQKTPMLVIEMKNQEKREMDVALLEKTDFKRLDKKTKNWILKEKGAVFSHVTMKYGLLETIDSIPISAEQLSILHRFANVFEQTYTRFLDLQKAEAQAREARIEAALEKVRAGMMAMHHSESLPEVMKVIAEQLIQLGIPMDAATFSPMNGEKDLNFWSATTERTYPVQLVAPYIDHTLFNLIYEAKTKQYEFITINLTKEDCDTWWNHFFTNTNAGPLVPEHRKEYILNTSGYATSMALGKNSTLNIVNFAGIPFSSEENAILKRFATVFEQSYTRFLDLQKAEAQAREAQIEAGLERVRSRSMAMHHTEELKEVIQVVFDQFVGLKIHVDHAGFILDYKQREDMHIWLADQQQGVPTEITIPYFDSPHWNSYLDAKARQESFFTNLLPFEVKNKFYRDLFEWIPELTEEAQQAILDKPALAISTVLLDNVGLYIEHYSETPFTAEENAVLMRFGKVFEQTYTRFLDLQKAEAQAREAQIQLSLERVRARAMAMHKSEELSEVATLLHKELRSLAFAYPFFNCGYVEVDEKNKTQHGWMTTPNGDFLERFNLPLVGDGVLQTRYDAWKRKTPVFCQKVGGSELKNHIDFATPNFGAEGMVEMVRTEFPDPVFFICGNFSNGYLHVVTGTQISASEELLLARFTQAFEMTHTRFLDLQKAEAQVREAKIEAALERVRSKSLAMHKSIELREVVNTLYGEFTNLEVNFNVVVIQLLKDRTKDLHLWISTADGLYEDVVHWPYVNMRHFNEVYEASTTQSPVAITLDQEETQAFFNEYFKLPEVPQGRKEATKAVGLIDIMGNFQKNTGIFLMRYTEGIYSSYEKDIILRFSKVFEQTYTRFLDLQKAEAQAREAQIEAALERVRSRTMAMHTPNELGEVVTVIVQKLTDLGVVLDANGVVLCTYFDDSKDVLHWIVSPDFKMAGSYLLPYFDHPIFKEAWESKESGDSYFSKAYSVEDKNSFFEYAFEHSDYRYFPEDFKQWVFQNDKHILSFAWQKNSAILIPSHTGVVPSSEEVVILKRFAKVFEQAYVRFLDLQKAEAQAREAIKRASVDRVRAEIASMRATADLERITPLIWNELTTLGVPFIRSGVFIMDEENQLVQTHLSTPDGKAIAAFQLNYEATNQTRQIVSHWREKKIFKDHMDEVAFAEFTKNLVQQGAMASNEKYVTENRPTDLYLHFLPFLQGMLYVGNDAPLKQDELHLVQNLAEAFSTAYARYEDFKKLELAKSAVESAMIELKATQAQLIQQEKLASLGQLTAGIAHEIKNPLNFVNNFSEVSIEMIEEVQEERIKPPESRDEGLVDEILEDIKSNLQKVHEHGTRANTIVSSMLQHSRGGSGKMEPTDLNALIKEYVNLSFHGMRAGKNPINVDIQLHLDETLGKVNLIGEDFSRVVLNLVNNAFDAMREKASKDLQGLQDLGGLDDYKPMLRVRTISENGKVSIEIEDNGPGIPDEIKDKILQPFFTTKKGTEGTGLGLSITHDIVKAHGGELEIETSMNKGTNFKIKLHT